MKRLQDDLVELVLRNCDEIEYVSEIPETGPSGDTELYIVCGDGYLQVEDDFLHAVNGMTTALYRADGTLLYGENPIVQALTPEERKDFRDAQITPKRIDGITWFIYDRALTGEGLEGLYLRGMVASVQGQVELNSILHTLLLILPLLLLLGLPIGYVIADRSLAPVRQIIGTAARINAGDDLKQRIGLEEGGDEIHQMAYAFDAMFNRLELVFEEERQFTSDASHELRTPLSVILAQCQMALEEDLTPEEYRDAIRLIGRQGNRMSRLIEDMLQISRLEQRPERFEKCPFDLSHMISELCEDMELIREKEITLSYEIEPDIRLNGNENLLRRMAANLISNAYHYGKTDGHIDVRLQRCDADHVLLKVEDDGIGISEEDQDNIFRRFYQADASRSGGNSGLGLYMVRQIAQLHGGTVRVKSEAGKGSTFLVDLPCPAAQHSAISQKN